TDSPMTLWPKATSEASAYAAGLRGEPEGWIDVGQQVHVGLHAVGPAVEADDEVSKPFRPPPGDQDGEEADDAAEGDANREEQQHDVVRDGEQPLHEDQQAAQVVRILHREAGGGIGTGVDSRADD